MTLGTARTRPSSPKPLAQKGGTYHKASSQETKEHGYIQHRVSVEEHGDHLSFGALSSRTEKVRDTVASLHHLRERERALGVGFVLRRKDEPRKVSVMLGVKVGDVRNGRQSPVQRCENRFHGRGKLKLYVVDSILSPCSL